MTRLGIDRIGRGRARWWRVGGLAALALAVVAVVAGGCAPLLGATSLRTAAPGRTTFHTLTVAGRERTFLLHLPPAAARGEPLPLVIAFHGFTGDANIMEDASNMDAAADRRGFIVAYPNGTGPLRYFRLSWNAAATCCGWAVPHEVDDVAFADSLARLLVRTVRADPRRVYAAGFSNGGMMALKVACEGPAIFAGAADVAGAMPDLPCQPRHAVPVLLFQGDEDEELPADHAAARRLAFLHFRRPRPFAVSLENALRFWARNNGCTGGVLHDSTAAYDLDRAQGCGPTGAVALYTVRGHPHAWPGGDPTWPMAPHPAPTVDATALILDFFARAGSAVLAGAGANGPVGWDAHAP